MLKIKKITLGMMQTNCYLLYDEISKQAIIIDPADNAQRIIFECENLDLSVKHVILTHGHFDHLGALDEICDIYDADILINENDCNCITDSIYNLSSHFLRREIIVKCNRIRYITEGKHTLIGYTFEFINTPGHTPGSMCIITGEHMFTGDTLFYMSIGNEFPPNGDFNLEIESIKNKLLVLETNYKCHPGHGEDTSLDFERKNNPYLR